MNIEQLQKIINKSKTKNDGVYKSDGYYYVVKDNHLRFYANEYTGDIHERAFGFSVSIGNVKPYELKKKLKELLKKL